MAAEPARVTGTLCNARIEKGHIAYPCTLGSGHENNWAEPHYAIEVAASVRAWRAWHEGMETEAANEQAKIDAPAADDAVADMFAAVHHSMAEEVSPALREQMYLIGMDSSHSMVRLSPSGRCHATLRSPRSSDTVLWCEQDEGHPGDHYAGERSWSVPTKTREGDQVLPTGGQQCVQDLIIAEMQESKQVGQERYGSVLKTFNGRSTIQDIAEEARDLHVYLTQVRAEAEADRETLVDVVAQAIRAADGNHTLGAGALGEVAVDAIMGWVVGQRAG